MSSWVLISSRMFSLSLHSSFNCFYWAFFSFSCIFSCFWVRLSNFWVYLLLIWLVRVLILSSVLFSKHFSRRKLLFWCGRWTNCSASKVRRSLAVSSSTKSVFFPQLKSLLSTSSLSLLTFEIRSFPSSIVSAIKTMRCGEDACCAELKSSYMEWHCLNCTSK